METHPESMLAIMAANPLIDRVIRNGWSQLALLDPDSATPRLWSDGEFHLYHPTGGPLATSASSAEWYNGCRDNLEFADITGQPV